MSRLANIMFSCALLTAVSVSGCTGARSSVPFLSSSGRPLSLSALTPAAKEGILSGSSASAWFRFNPSKAFPGNAQRAIQVSLVTDSADPVSVSLGFVTGADFDASGRLVSEPAARNLATLSRFDGSGAISMIVPPASSSSAAVCGFAVSMESAGNARLRISGAEVSPPAVGWRKSRSSRWVGFSAAGGMLDAAVFASGAVSSVPVAVPPDSVLTLSFAPSLSPADGSGSAPSVPDGSVPGISGAIARQGRSRFSANERVFSYRTVPAPFTTSVPSVLFGNAPVTVRSMDADGPLSGITAVYGASVPAAEPANPLSPILADPHVMIEWPRSAWRRSDRELFAWDRFPSILVFDTADYAVQDRYFKRLAFFVEKEGYRGKLMRDDELEGLHAFNAHDYRAESLAAFFEKARKEEFPLNAEENELRDILLAEGIIARSSKKFIPGAGAVLSFSRESVSYLRYMFVAHEGFHGIYFIDPDFRAKVSAVYRSMDSRATAFLESYFSLYDSLGYDTGDAYLMENEFMAYLLQQPLEKVAPYFTGIIHERFLRNGGNQSLAGYVVDSGAAEFVRAAEELNEYVFTRWGIAGGRVGLFSISD